MYHELRKRGTSRAPGYVARHGLRPFAAEHGLSAFARPFAATLSSCAAVPRRLRTFVERRSAASAASLFRIRFDAAAAVALLQFAASCMPRLALSRMPSASLRPWVFGS